MSHSRGYDRYREGYDRTRKRDDDRYYGYKDGKRPKRSSFPSRRNKYDDYNSEDDTIEKGAASSSGRFSSRSSTNGLERDVQNVLANRSTKDEKNKLISEVTQRNIEKPEKNFKPNSEADNKQISAEEKMRLRQERIEKWKKAKAAKEKMENKNKDQTENENKPKIENIIPNSKDKINTNNLTNFKNESTNESKTLDDKKPLLDFSNKNQSKNKSKQLKVNKANTKKHLGFDNEIKSKKNVFEFISESESSNIQAEDQTDSNYNKKSTNANISDSKTTKYNDKSKSSSFGNSEQVFNSKSHTRNSFNNAKDIDSTNEADEVDPLDAFMSSIDDLSNSRLKIAPGTGIPFDYDDDEREGNISELYDPDNVLATKMNKKRKDIPQVNHEQVNYEPFRKEFYHEPEELASMTEKEADKLRLLLDGIKIRGIKCPKPVLKWAQFGLPVQTMQVIQNLGYEQPSSIQAQAIPSIMSGRDVIGVAKTGSGKTIAFLLPLFRHIKDQRPLESLEGPISVIMTPTRELAVQIFCECKPFLKALNLRAVCCYGGSSIKEQIAELKRGAEIVVCTPGRMIDLLAANNGRVINLKRVTYVVIDEADRMFDMGFEPQVMKILNNIRPDRQTVLFSATFPRKMEALARQTLTNPLEIVVGARSVVAPEVTQIVEVRDEATKFKRLLELLGELYNKDEDARTLIFVERQEAADELLNALMKKGYPCMSIHGGKEQSDRDSSVSDFKAGVVPILIATSVAARGLDVKQLKLVINYDSPNHLEDYVHRVGRTGRAGNKGTAVTFITPFQERQAVDISKALRLSKQEIPEEVQKLADEFLAKVKAGKSKFSFGFGGNGLDKLDETRQKALKLERKAYGEEDDVKSDDEDVTLEGQPEDIKTTTDSNNENNDPILNRVKQASSSVESKFAGSASATLSGPAPDNRGPDSADYHATLTINDFPQKARWAVTNRGNIAKIIESTRTSITNKGNYYPPGKLPGPNDLPKLYLLIEGDSEISVGAAMNELKRLLSEATSQALDNESRIDGRVYKGRFSVVGPNK